MVISLIGPRGAGKSAVGRLLAEQLRLTFVDADEAIEQAAGRTVASIFAEEGEATFRMWEERVMAELLAGSERVIASGGGAILSAETRGRMKTAGPVVYLRVSAGTATARLAHDPAAKRPALTALSPEQEMEAILAARAPLYEATATLIVSAEQATPAELAGEIARQLLASVMETTA